MMKNESSILIHTETDHRWNGLAIGWQAQLLADRALVALDALFLPGAHCAPVVTR
jgi:hypothetical protein